MNERARNICYGLQEVPSELHLSNLIVSGIVTGVSSGPPVQPVEGHGAGPELLCSVLVSWAVWGLPVASRP